MYDPPRMERLVTEYMPIVDHVRPQVMLLEDGSVMAMYELDGVQAETTDAVEVNWLIHRLNLTYRNIATMRPEITIYDCRGFATEADYPTARPSNQLARSIDDAYKCNLLDGSLYRNGLYFAVHIPNLNAAGSWVGERVRRWRHRTGRIAGGIAERVAALETLCGQLSAELKPYGPRRLGVVRRNRVPCSEIAEAVAFAFSGTWRQIPLVVGSGEADDVHGRLGNVVITDQVVVGPEAVELRGPGASTFVAAFAMREYPSESWPGMFHALAIGRYRRTVFHSFTLLLGADAMAQVSRKQNRMTNAEDKAYSQIAGLSVLNNQLQSNELVLGLHSMTVLVFGESLPALNVSANRVATDYAACGAVVIRERRALEAAIFSIFHGNARLRVRPGTISSVNFAAMAPLHGYPSGPKVGRWGREPIAVFRSLAGTPVNFHFATSKYGNGNTLLTGESGSGKTLLGAFINSQSTRYAGIFALDHKRGWEVLFRGMGSPYAVLGSGNAYFAPLKALDDANHNVEFLTELLRSAIMQGGEYEPTDEEGRRLHMAVKSVLELPPEDRWLEDVRAFLGPRSAAAARLQKWCHGEELGWVMDAPADTIDMTRDINAVDITQLMANSRARGPAIVYIMYRIALRLRGNGRPFLVPIDEGWLVAEDPVFSPLVFAQARTIRSRNGVLIFITQSPADAAKPGIAEALVEQFPNQIHMANPRAQKHHYVDGLKRTERQYDIIRNLPVEQGMFLLSQGNKATICQLLMSGLEDQQMVLSLPEELFPLVDEAREKTGGNPARFIAEYHRSRLERAPT